MAAERVKRLKDLVEMVMRLPESPERDRLLSEVRSRAVDLDTGVTPRAMLPMREPAPVPVAALPKRRAVMQPPRAVMQPPRAVMQPPRAVMQPPRAAAPPPDVRPSWDQVLGAGHLSLDDSPSRHDGRTARPWTLGLRG